MPSNVDACPSAQLSGALVVLTVVGAALEALVSCRSADAVGAVVAAATTACGFTAVACGVFRSTESGPEPHLLFASSALLWSEVTPPGGPLVAAARRRFAPFAWRAATAPDIPRGTARPGGASGDAPVAVPAAHWPRGLAVPLHGPGGHFALFVAAGGEPSPPAPARAALHLLALTAHEQCRRGAGWPPLVVLETPLTARELQCLRWVAAGKTDWEIAAILQVAPTTVKTHVDQARRKLGSRTRPQAVARLIRAGFG
jgi:LuxR family quorum sensing-dependent transcriptional regulator